MYNGKILVPTETLSPDQIEELEQEFGNLRWISDKLVMIEFGPTLVNPVDSHDWVSGTHVVLSWVMP